MLTLHIYINDGDINEDS